MPLTRPIPEPIPGKFYFRNSFVFHVDFVRDGSVYLLKWRTDSPPDSQGEGIQVPLDVWNEEMVGAEPCDSPFEKASE